MVVFIVNSISPNYYKTTYLRGIRTCQIGIKINSLSIFGIIVAERLRRLVSPLSIFQNGTQMTFPGEEEEIMERSLLDVIQMKVHCHFSI